jgi:uncharacterized protein
MILHELAGKNLIHPPKWLPNNTVLLMVMGSQAYGVSNDDSDCDVYGVCVPPKELVFPHLSGEIFGFGKQVQRFDSWSEHHIKHPNREVEYDFAVFGLVKYFQLCMENNPNLIDSLFVPRNCIIHSTPIGEHIRENRLKFLHRGAWHKFKGYSYSQASKIRNKVNSSNPKRASQIQEHGYDLKFAYHCIRLMNEVEQILVEGDLDLQRNREQLKSIRRGEWTIEQFEDYFSSKEKNLETAYANSKLPATPNEEQIKKILLECLEMQYGNIDAAVSRTPELGSLVNDLQRLVEKYQQK